MSRYIQSLLYGGLVRPAFRAGGVGANRQDPVPTVLVENRTSVDGTSADTAEVTPVANQPTIAYLATQSATAAETPTCSGAGLTWTLSKSIIWTTTRRLFIFTAPGIATVTPGALTFDFGAETQTAFVWSVLTVAGAKATGFLRQAPDGTTSGAGATSLAAPTLSALEHGNNINISAFGFNTSSPTCTPDANFTELSDNGTGSNATGLEVQWARYQIDCTATFAAATVAALSIEVVAA